MNYLPVHEVFIKEILILEDKKKNLERNKLHNFSKFNILHTVGYDYKILRYLLELFNKEYIDFWEDGETFSSFLKNKELLSSTKFPSSENFSTILKSSNYFSLGKEKFKKTEGTSQLSNKEIETTYITFDDSKGVGDITGVFRITIKNIRCFVPLCIIKRNFNKLKEEFFEYITAFKMGNLPQILRIQIKEFYLTLPKKNTLCQY